MTNSDYAGRGIFKSLSTELYNFLETEYSCKAIWGFPNSNSHYAFINSLRWENISMIHTLSIPSNLYENIKMVDNLVGEFEDFQEVHADFISEKLTPYPVKVKRNVEYLNWRYVEKPSVKYRKFFSLENGSRFLAVTKIYPSPISGLWNLNIMELFMDDFTQFPQLIKFILHSYSLQFNAVTLWCSIFDPNYLKLEKQGFKPDLPLAYLGARVRKEYQPVITNYKNWYISMGDSDVF